MIAKNTYAIAIATLSGWLKNLAAVFQPMRSKNKNQSHLVRAIYPALSASYTISRNYDWFIALFAPVVIGRNNYFVIGH